MSSLRNLSLKTRIVAAVCFVNLAVIILVSYGNYHWYSAQLTDQTMEQTQQIIEQAGSNINTYINELYRLTLTPYYNDELLHTLEQTATSPQQQLEFKRVVEGFLASVMSLPRSEILRVYIMNDTALYSYTRTPYEMAEYNNYLESDWYNQACATTDPILLPPRLERVYGDDLTPIFSVVRQLRSKEDNDITLGVVKVDANYTGIRNICDQVDLDAGGSLLIINEQNQILYSSGALLQELDAEEVEALASPAQGDLFRSGQGKYIVNRFVLPDCGIALLAVHSYASLMRPLQENLVKTVLLALGSMLVAAALIIFVVARFLKPLFDIIRLMHAVEGGDLQVRAQVRSHNEIGYLAESFNDMVGALGSMIQRNAQLAQEVYRAQYLNKEAQYNSLCSQIKPHFLYNVLNTISLLIKCGEYKTAVRSVEDLSYYLGGIMNVDQDITLRRELNICQAYLDLIQLRYQDRLTYTIQVDEDLLDCKIPSLTLQPLIENAVKYACEPRRQATEIAVTSRREDGMLRLCVTDNGPGIGEATLEKIRRSMEEPDAGPGADGGDKGSIGILNIYRRLRLRYGRQAAFLIDTSGQGTCVSLRIPLPCEGENNVSYDDRG